MNSPRHVEVSSQIKDTLERTRREVEAMRRRAETEADRSERHALAEADRVVARRAQELSELRNCLAGSTAEATRLLRVIGNGCRLAADEVVINAVERRDEAGRGRPEGERSDER